MSILSDMLLHLSSMKIVMEKVAAIPKSSVLRIRANIARRTKEHP